MSRINFATRTILVAVVSTLSLSCGGDSGAPDSKEGSGSLEIVSAEWREEPEPRAVVSGEWIVGISTPPSCILLEGKAGEPSGWYDSGNRIELDGGRFHREFVRALDSESPDTLDPQTEYYARCRVSVDTGKTIEATAPVKGDVPTS